MFRSVYLSRLYLQQIFKMAVLGDLPFELMADICSYLSSDDYQNLSLVSKHIRVLADEYLVTHQRLQGALSLIELPGIWSSAGIHGQPVMSTLDRILRNPHQATYIRTVSMYQWPASSFWLKLSKRGEVRTLRRCREDTADFLEKRLVIEAIQGLSHLSKSDLSDWMYAARIGQQATFISLLALLAPNLRTIRMTKIEALQDAFTDAIMYATKNPAAGFFAHLTTIHMSFCEIQGSYTLLLAFMALPAMKTLHCDGVEPGDLYNRTQAGRLIPLRSNLVELSLRDHWLRHDSICQLLDFCPCLKVFEATVRIHPSDSFYGPNYSAHVDAIEPLPHPSQVANDESPVAKSLNAITDSNSTERPNTPIVGEKTTPITPHKLERLVFRDRNYTFEHYKSFFTSLPSLLELEIEFRVTQLSACSDDGFVEKFASTGRLRLPKLILIYEPSEEPFLAGFLWELVMYKRRRMPSLKHVHFQKREGKDLEVEGEKPYEYVGNERELVERSGRFGLAEIQGCLAVGVIVTSD